MPNTKFKISVAGTGYVGLVAGVCFAEVAVGFKPKTTIEDGLQRFGDWYCEYYQVK